MTLFERAAFASFAASLPGVTLNEQWGSLVAKVGGKVFCLRGESTGELVFKVHELAFEVLSGSAGIGQAPYFAKRQWVSVEPRALDDEALAAYIRQSYQLIAGRLTKKARAEFGILLEP